MASRSLISLLLLLLFAGVAHADVEQLKRDIESLKKQHEQAQVKQHDAEKALADNLKAQAGASGKDLERLKTSARSLARTAHNEAENVKGAERNLAAKQSELRKEASESAVGRISAKGDLDARVDAARSSISDWRGAIGPIPGAPMPRDLTDIPEDDRAAFRRTDAERLRSYEAWADLELARIDNELAAADKLLAWNVADAESGEKLTSDARALKSSLDTRRKAVKSARDGAKATREGLEKAARR